MQSLEYASFHALPTWCLQLSSVGDDFCITDIYVPLAFEDEHRGGSIQLLACSPISLTQQITLVCDPGRQAPPMFAALPKEVSISLEKSALLFPNGPKPGCSRR